MIIKFPLIRGLSSTVRRCKSRENGLEYAVKIINKSQDVNINESIAAEVEILKILPPHPHISKLHPLILYMSICLFIDHP